MDYLLNFYYRYKQENKINFYIWLLNEMKNNKKILISSLTIFSVLFTILNFFIYAVGYVFLYGFLFGGTLGDYNTSVMEIFINPVPFNFYTVMIIGYLIVIGAFYFYLIIRYFIKLVKKFKNDQFWKKAVKFLWLLCAFLFIFALMHLGLVSFFVSGSDIVQNYFSFLTLWIVPLLLFIFVYWKIRGAKYPFSSISGLLYSFMLLGLLIKNNINIYQNNLFEFLSPFLIFGGSLLFSFFKNMHRVNSFISTLLVFPFPLLGVYVLNYSFLFIKNQKVSLTKEMHVIFFIVSLIVSIILGLYIVERNKNKVNNNEASSISNRIIVFSYERLKAKKESLVFLVPIFTLFLLFLMPKILFFSSIYIRETANFSGIPIVEKEIIYIEDSFSDQSNLKEIFPHKGFVVSEKNGTYYIVNNNWRLERISNIKIITIPNTTNYK